MLPLIIYDSECPLCVRFKQGLERLDLQRSLHFASLHDENIFTRYPELKRDECRQVVHLLTLEKKILRGSEIVGYLVASYPGISKLAWLLETDQGKKVLDYFYQKVDEIRLKFKEEENCPTCPDSKTTL